MTEDKDAQQVEEDAHEDLELKDEDAEQVSGGSEPFEIKDYGFGVEH